jgi:GWxTD domain-containing protein
MKYQSNFIRVLTVAVAVVAAMAMAGQAADELAIRAGLAITNDPSLDSMVFLEFPFSVRRSQFQFFRPDSTDPSFYARVFAQVVLIDSRGLAIDSTNTYFSLRSSSVQEAAQTDQQVFNQLGLLVRPGVYTARLTVIDAVNKAEGDVFYDNIVAAPARPGQLTIGGERLANLIKPIDSIEARSDRMAKNGLKVLTNPISLFGTADTVMYLYAEVYNLQYSQDETSTYELSFRILGDQNLPVKDLGYTKRKKPGESAVITQRFDLRSLWPGLYNVELAAGDDATGQADTVLLAFRIISPEEVAELAASVRTNVDAYDSLSLEQQVQVVTFMLTPEQRSILGQLSDIGKMSFLTQFWQEHDEVPLTSYNETRAERLRRYQYANRNFSLAGDSTSGWHTDRGRILMTYGNWDEQDNSLAPVAGQPYSVWYYRRLDEGLVFVFADRRGYGDFELVHSNADGERFDTEWAERLKDQSFFEFEQDVDLNN